MPSQPEKQPPRCVLCSMCCPMGVETDPLGHMNTVFPLDLGYEQGACVRGLTAGRLLRAENRIYEAVCDGEVIGMDEALSALVDRLKEYDGSEVGLLLDANRPLEVLSAAADVDGWKVSAAVPPEDDPFVRTGCGALPPLKNIAEADTVLAIGDPFSTHPVIAEPVRDMQKAGRGHKLVCVDTALGRTARTADEMIFVHPSKLAALLCAAAIEMRRKSVKEALNGITPSSICDEVGLSMDDVHTVANAIQDAESPAVIVSNSVARYACAGAAIRAAREMSSAAKTSFYGLTSSPNAAAVRSLGEKRGYLGQAELLESVANGDLKALVVVGVDLANMFPRAVVEKLSGQLEMLVWAGSLKSRLMQELTDISLPVALAWEEAGSIVLPGGEGDEVKPWLDRARGVPTAEELLSALAERAGVGTIDTDGAEAVKDFADSEVPVDEEIKGAVLEAAEADGEEAVLIGAPEPYAYTGGVSLMGGHWQMRTAAGEEVVLTPAAAQAAGAEEEQVVTLSGAADMALPSAVRSGCDASVAAVAAHRSDVRGLLDWQIEGGRIVVDPVVVKISV